MSERFSLGPHSVRILADFPDAGFAEGTFAPNIAGPPAHSHAWDEGFYVVEGTLRVEVDGNSHILEKGDFAMAHGGSVHTFAVEGPATATFVATFGSAHGLAYLREMAAIMSAGDPSSDHVAAALAELRSAYGVATHS